MKTVKAFVTEDGKVHLTEYEAKQHESFLVFENEIDMFLASDLYPYKDKKSPYGKVVKKCLAAWEIYKGQQK